MIAVSVSGQDHVHIVTTSREGIRAARRQFAGIARAVTGKKVRTLGLDGVLGYLAKNVAVDGGKWIDRSRAVMAARRDSLASLKLPDPELDRLFDGWIAAEARRNASDASGPSQGPWNAPDPSEALPAPSYGPDAIDHPPAESTLPAEDRTGPQETGASSK